MGEEQAFSAVQGCNGSHILTAFRKGAPRFDLTIILFQIFSGCFLLLEHMGLDLIDSRLDPCKMLQIQIAIQTKIRYADGTNFPCFIKFLHSTIGSVIIAKGLVDQQQVNIIRPQLFQGFLNGSLRFLVPCIGDPYLCGQEKFFPRKTTFGKGSTYALLVVVGLCGIDTAMASNTHRFVSSGGV